MMLRLSDDQFRQAHNAHLASAWWKDFRREVLAHYRYRCAVCGLAYQKRGHSRRQLHVDHRRYWRHGELIFGQETLVDVRCVCPAHHGQGVRSDAAIAGWATRYRWWRVLVWFALLPLQVVAWSGRWLWQALTAAQGPDDF